jgi:acyl carrier protein
MDGHPKNRAMTKENILRQLTEVFHQLFDDDSIVLTSETDASDIAEWDSMNHISLIVAVEVRFGIKFQTAETESLKNVGDFVSLIQEKIAAQGK